MTGSPPGPAPSRDPGLDERTANPFRLLRTRPLHCLRRPHCSPTQAPASRPSGRYAVGLRPSLDPDAYLEVCCSHRTVTQEGRISPEEEGSLCRSTVSSLRSTA